jgi:hypothetical protein
MAITSAVHAGARLRYCREECGRVGVATNNFQAILYDLIMPTWVTSELAINIWVDVAAEASVEREGIKLTTQVLSKLCSRKQQDSFVVLSYSVPFTTEPLKLKNSITLK